MDFGCFANADTEVLQEPLCVCARAQVCSCAHEEMLLLRMMIRGVCAAAGLFTPVQAHCIKGNSGAP